MLPLSVSAALATPITLATWATGGNGLARQLFRHAGLMRSPPHPYLRGWLKLKLVRQKPPDALAKLRAFPFPDVIQLIDPIPKADACNMMCDVDGLLLLNPTGLKRYIQGKLYEYIASGTPVLVLAPGRENITWPCDNRKLDAGPVIAENDAGILSHAIESISSWDMQAKSADGRGYELAGPAYPRGIVRELPGASKSACREISRGPSRNS